MWRSKEAIKQRHTVHSPVCEVQARDGAPKPGDEVITAVLCVGFRVKAWLLDKESHTELPQGRAWTEVPDQRQQGRGICAGAVRDVQHLELAERREERDVADRGLQ